MVKIETVQLFCPSVYMKRSVIILREDHINWEGINSGWSDFEDFFIFNVNFKLLQLLFFSEQTVNEIEILQLLSDSEIEKLVPSIGEKIRLKRAISNLTSGVSIRYSNFHSIELRKTFLKHVSILLNKKFMNFILS